MSDDGSRYDYDMPWNVRRDGAVLEVQITEPVGSWGTLFDVVEQHIRDGIVSAVMPESIPDAPPIDRVLLQRLRDELTVIDVELLELQPLGF